MSDAQSRDDERAARLAAQRKAWNDAHPTYYAEYRDRNREEIRRKNREYMRDQAQRERDEKERRQKGIERAKAWAKEHPEERQQARERYKQKHPEAYKQAQRDYYHRNREAIAERRRAREAADPDKANEARRRAVDRAREAGRDSAWSPTPDQRAAYRERENEARRQARRRACAGLPDRQLHRVHAPERRHNDAAADAFFAQKRSSEDVARIRAQDEPTPPRAGPRPPGTFGQPSSGARDPRDRRRVLRRARGRVAGARRRSITRALQGRDAAPRRVHRAASPRAGVRQPRLPPRKRRIPDVVVDGLPLAHDRSCQARTRTFALIDPHRVRLGQRFASCVAAYP